VLPTAHSVAEAVQVTGINITENEVMNVPLICSRVPGPERTTHTFHPYHVQEESELVVWIDDMRLDLRPISWHAHSIFCCSRCQQPEFNVAIAFSCRPSLFSRKSRL